ncbi:hypothetical protein EYF80_030354 [Liparis tanakae]|uniref:Uncharacterized protein n=1 Tax=Liparis tanakae TaxID=230148 RepID=A0A4Z2H0Z9_9TELE|nr:hypothetical protein EYF80_030354 [Liparis tanakae]
MTTTLSLRCRSDRPCDSCPTSQLTLNMNAAAYGEKNKRHKGDEGTCVTQEEEEEEEEEEESWRDPSSVSSC